MARVLGGAGVSNPSKRKGTTAETALLRWLHDNGHPDALRNPPAGSKDVGDLETLAYCNEAGHYVRCTIEVKHYSAERMSTALANGTAELEVEKANAGTAHGVLVVRRPGVTDPSRWYAVRLVKDDPEIGANHA